MIIETWNWNQLYWSASLVNFEFKNCKMNSLPHRDTHSPAWRLNALLVHIWCRFYFWLFATSKWCSGIAWAIAKSICARVYSLSPAWWVFLLVVFRFLSIFLHFSLAFGCGFLAIVAYIVHIYNVACVCCMHVAAQNKLRINTLENKGTAESRISLTSQYMYMDEIERRKTTNDENGSTRWCDACVEYTFFSGLLLLLLRIKCVGSAHTFNVTLIVYYWVW